MIRNIENISEITEPTIEEFNLWAATNELSGKVKVDHIGLKCSSKEVFESTRAVFEQEKFIYQSIISKRRVAIIGLKKGINTILGDLNYLELSDQKPDGSQTDKFDHLEIIPSSISYDELVFALKEKGIDLIEVIRPHHTTYDIKLPSGFIVRLSREMLLEKIKRDEMV
jgi:predicted metalloenzyme YecM